MRKILLLGLLVVLIASCSKKTNVEITGAIKDAANTKVYLEQIDVSSRKQSTQQKLTKTGSLNLNSTSSSRHSILLDFLTTS